MLFKTGAKNCLLSSRSTCGPALPHHRGLQPQIAGRRPGRMPSNRFHQLEKEILIPLERAVIFILIGLLAAQGHAFIYGCILCFFGTSLSLLLSFFVPPIVLRWILISLNSANAAPSPKSQLSAKPAPIQAGAAGRISSVLTNTFEVRVIEPLCTGCSPCSPMPWLPNSLITFQALIVSPSQTAISAIPKDFESF